MAGDLWFLATISYSYATVSGDVERARSRHDFCHQPSKLEYANMPKDKPRGKHRPILNGDFGDDLSNATRLDR
jgi:hypothetical protein